jgi:hypothetical protein
MKRYAVKEWTGEELEESGEKAGMPMPLGRNIKAVLKMDAFTKSVGLMPLVSVEKVGETDPIPFTPNPKTQGEYKYPLTPSGSWQPSWL